LNLIWGSFLIEILILSLIKPFIFNFDSAAIIAVLIHVVLTVIFLLNVKNKFKLIFLGSFLTRVALLFWDVYGRNIFMLPHSGTDSEVYYSQALFFSRNLSAILSDTGFVYPKIIGFIFYFIGPQRILGQYINVLLGLSIVFIIYRILNILEIRPKISNTIILLAAFFPISIILSSIFLREMFITFFVASSLYYFIKWYKSARYTEMLLSIFFIGIASMFHAGVIGIIFGYFLAFLFYNKKKKTFRVTIRTLISLMLIVPVVLSGFILFDDIILGKFTGVDEISDIYKAANYRRGGSAYLTNIKIDNMNKLIFYTPIKTIYLLISPLPMDWRDSIDIFSFFMDSTLYLTVIIYFLMNIKKFGDQKTLIIILTLVIISVALIFGVGVGNAGTAIRHRQKFISLFLILLGVMMNAKEIYKGKVLKN
jgi:hypothetical protein